MRSASNSFSPGRSPTSLISISPSGFATSRTLRAESSIIPLAESTLRAVSKGRTLNLGLGSIGARPVMVESGLGRRTDPGQFHQLDFALQLSDQ